MDLNNAIRIINIFNAKAETLLGKGDKRTAIDLSIALEYLRIKAIYSLRDGGLADSEIRHIQEIAGDLWQSKVGAESAKKPLVSLR